MGPCVGDMWSDKISILCNMNDMKPFFKTKVIRILRCEENICCYILSFFIMKFFSITLLSLREKNTTHKDLKTLVPAIYVINMGCQFKYMLCTIRSDLKFKFCTTYWGFTIRLLYLLPQGVRYQNDTCTKNSCSQDELLVPTKLS